MQRFLDKFGTTLIFVFALFLLFIGVKALIHLADPWTRKVSSSLADALRIV